MQPNYARYSEEQLLDVQREIDRDRFPKRAAEIDALLSNPESRAQARYIQSQVNFQRQVGRKRRRAVYLSLLPVFIGVFIGLAFISTTEAHSPLADPLHIPKSDVLGVCLIVAGVLGLYGLLRKRYLK